MMSNLLRTRKTAPQFAVPDVPIVSIEHLASFKMWTRPSAMLGRDSDIADSLERGNEDPIGLNFQPDDPTSREVLSYNNKTNNLLLKVTVPKRIRMRAKRASADDAIEVPQRCQIIGTLAIFFAPCKTILNATRPKLLVQYIRPTFGEPCLTLFTRPRAPPFSTRSEQRYSLRIIRG